MYIGPTIKKRLPSCPTNYCKEKGDVGLTGSLGSYLICMETGVLRAQGQAGQATQPAFRGVGLAEEVVMVAAERFAVASRRMTNI